jgi:hypothetical protein
MIIMVKSMRKLTKKMVLVVDAGTTVASKRASSKTDNLMAFSERFLKMAQSFKECGLKGGDMAKAVKNHEMLSLSGLANGTITIISNEQ